MDNFDIDDDWEDFQAWIGGVNCVSVALAGGNAIERTLTAAEPFEAGQVAMMVPWRCALTAATAERALRREEKRRRPLLRMSVDDFLRQLPSMCKRCAEMATSSASTAPEQPPPTTLTSATGNEEALLRLQAWTTLLALQLLAALREAENPLRPYLRFLPAPTGSVLSSVCDRGAQATDLLWVALHENEQERDKVQSQAQAHTRGGNVSLPTLATQTVLDDLLDDDLARAVRTEKRRLALLHRELIAPAPRPDTDTAHGPEPQLGPTHHDVEPDKEGTAEPVPVISFASFLWAHALVNSRAMDLGLELDNGGEEGEEEAREEAAQPGGGKKDGVGQRRDSRADPVDTLLRGLGLGRGGPLDAILGYDGGGELRSGAPEAAADGAPKAARRSVRAILPMIDMANHAHSSRTSAQLRAGWKGVALVATRTVDTGAALTLHYGHRPLSEWAKQYAFVPEHNGGGRAQFRLPSLSSSVDAEVLQATASTVPSALASHAACILNIDAGEGEVDCDDSSMVGKIMEWRLEKADTSSDTFHVVGTPCATSCADSIDSDEYSATATLILRAERLLLLFDDDDEAQKCADSAAQLAARYRLARRRLLLQAVDGLRCRLRLPLVNVARGLEESSEAMKG